MRTRTEAAASGLALVAHTVHILLKLIEPILRSTVLTSRLPAEDHSKSSYRSEMMSPLGSDESVAKVHMREFILCKKMANEVKTEQIHVR